MRALCKASRIGIGRVLNVEHRLKRAMHISSLYAEVESLYWMKLLRGYQLSVRRKEGTSLNFMGFRERVSKCSISPVEPRAVVPAAVVLPNCSAWPACLSCWNLMAYSLLQDFEALNSYATATLGVSIQVRLGRRGHWHAGPRGAAAHQAEPCRPRAKTPGVEYMLLHNQSKVHASSQPHA